MRAIEVFKNAAQRPIEAIEALIALVCFFFGLYLSSPFYVVTSTAAASQVFDQSVPLHLLIGFFFFILPALPIVLSLFWDRFATRAWRARSTYWMFIGLTFITLLRLITIGFFPAVWVFSLTVGLISAVCYLYVRVRS